MTDSRIEAPQRVHVQMETVDEWLETRDLYWTEKETSKQRMLQEQQRSAETAAIS